MNGATKKVLKYTLLPQIAPRLHNLFGSGFSFIAFAIAQIFASVNLLPRHHPYLNVQNAGRYHIRHTIVEAWNHLRFDWKHIDQVLIYFVIILGLVILIAQFALLFFGVFGMTSAMALGLPAYFDTMFETTNPVDDIAFIMMDRVFGIPNLFDSCVATGVACFQNTPYNPGNVVVDMVFPSPFHIAFHQMLSAYSYGLMVVAAIIIFYFVITVVGETAQSGTPFGHRFNHVWAPLRLVVALGLLIPTASGLNSAQYIVLYAAKFGSGFATNGWNIFLTGAGVPGTGTILGNPDDLVVTPKAPPANNLLEFGSSLAACIKTQRFFYQRQIQAFLINPSGMTAATSRLDLATTPTYATALQFSDSGDMYFVFGEFATDDGTAAGRPIHVGYPAFVKPICGEIVLQMTDVAGAYSPGSETIMTAWYNLIAYVLWYDALNDSGVWASGSMGLIGTGAARKHIAGYPAHDTTIEVVAANVIDDIRDGYRTYIENTILSGVVNQRTAPSWNNLDDYGWAGAAIWYNKIAELNGMLIGAANSLPAVRSYPMVMEAVKKERDKYDQDISGAERFMPRRSDGTEIKLKDDTEYKEAEVMYAAYKVWGQGSSNPTTGNIFIDAVMAFFGTTGLYDMVANTDIHPLAQLVGVGKSLVESSIRNLGGAAFAGLAGGVANIMGQQGLGNFASLASGVFAKVAMFGLTAGFLLFYIVPFMPFLYFFFAMGIWIKTILEAVVGVPLWALAHLRIDGNGLPGSAAMGGYYLIFDVFLRPICIVFGLLASIAIFGAQVKILHQIWPLVTSNLTGFEAGAAKLPAPADPGGINWFRGIIDQFMFTVIYAFLVYMMAMSSFKLIDIVPDYVLRWMGAGVQTFGGIAKDDVAGMPTKAVVGVGAGVGQAMQAGGQAMNAVKIATAPAPKAPGS